MSRTKRRQPTELELEVLRHLASSGSAELGDLAARWWGSEITSTAEALERLQEEGLVRAEHMYPSQLLLQRISPTSLAGRGRGARSLYRLTRQGRTAART